MFEERIATMNEETSSTQQVQQTGKRTYTVDEIQDILGISQPTAYALIKKIYFIVFELEGTFEFLKLVLMHGWTIKVNMSRITIFNRHL